MSVSAVDDTVDNRAWVKRFGNELSTRQLVLGMADEAGTINAAAVYKLAEAIGLSHQQVRLCFRRLVGEGLFAQQGRGQHAIFAATSAGQGLLKPDSTWLNLAYRQDAGLEPWDGIWHMVGFAVPEAKRAARDDIRIYLLTIGGALLEGGWYISPHAWEPEVHATGKQLGIAEAVTLVEASQINLGGITDPRQIAASLWPLEAIAMRYRSFIDTFTPLVGQLDSRAIDDTELVSAALAMAALFDASIRHDPLLPAELLPEDWPGRTARRLLVLARRKSLKQSALLRHSVLFRSFDRVMSGEMLDR